MWSSTAGGGQSGKGPLAGGRLVARVCQSTLIGLMFAGAVAGQVPAWPQSEVLYGGEPAPTGFAFGQQVNASGRGAVASGVGLDGSQLLRAWEREPFGTQWQVVHEETFAAGAATARSPVATTGGRIYRAADDPVFGFLTREKNVATVTPMPWQFIWTPTDPSARATSMDATTLVDGSFAVGGLLAVGYQTALSNPAFLVGEYAILVRVSLSGYQLVYSDALVFGGEPSVSADNFQVAVGLPGLSQVVVVTSGPNEPWVEEQVINGPTTIGFGSAVALRGDRLAVGAPQGEVCAAPPSTDCVTSGQVYLYARANGTWTLDRILLTEAIGLPEGALAGSALDFGFDSSGTPLRRVAIGAPGWVDPDLRGGGGAGTVVVVAENAAGDWAPLAQARTTPAESNGLGSSVAFDAFGDLLVSAPLHLQGANQVGAALLFRDQIFSDGFDLGTVSAWSASTP